MDLSRVVRGKALAATNVRRRTHSYNEAAARTWDVFRAAEQSGDKKELERKVSSWNKMIEEDSDAKYELTVPEAEHFVQQKKMVPLRLQHGFGAAADLDQSDIGKAMVTGFDESKGDLQVEFETNEFWASNIDKLKLKEISLSHDPYTGDVIEVTVTPKGARSGARITELNGKVYNTGPSKTVQETQDNTTVISPVMASGQLQQLPPQQQQQQQQLNGNNSNSTVAMDSSQGNNGNRPTMTPAGSGSASVGQNNNNNNNNTVTLPANPTEQLWFKALRGLSPEEQKQFASLQIAKEEELQKERAVAARARKQEEDTLRSTQKLMLHWAQQYGFSEAESTAAINELGPGFGTSRVALKMVEAAFQKPAQQQQASSSPSAQPMQIDGNNTTNNNNNNNNDETMANFARELAALHNTLPKASASWRAPVSGHSGAAGHTHAHDFGTRSFGSATFDKTLSPADIAQADWKNTFDRTMNPYSSSSNNFQKQAPLSYQSMSLGGTPGFQQYQQSQQFQQPAAIAAASNQNPLRSATMATTALSGMHDPHMANVLSEVYGTQVASNRVMPINSEYDPNAQQEGAPMVPAGSSKKPKWG